MGYLEEGISATITDPPHCDRRQGGLRDPNVKGYTAAQAQEAMLTNAMRTRKLDLDQELLPTRTKFTGNIRVVHMPTLSAFLTSPANRTLACTGMAHYIADKAVITEPSQAR